MTRLLDLNDVRLLMRIIEHGSYTAASQAVGVPKSTLSQRIAALERSVGTGLLRRTSRSLSLTQAGRDLLPHARAIEEVARRAEAALLDQAGALKGTLRLSCSTALAQTVLAPLLLGFLARHDGATVRVETSNRPVDLVADGFDMTLLGHVGALKDSTLRQRVVARAPWIVVASPAWLDTHGVPGTPSEIPAGEVLCFSRSSACEDWTLSRGDEVAAVAVSPRLLSDDMATLQAAAIAGGGVTCLPSYLLRASLNSGHLVQILQEWVGPRSTISVLTPPREQSSRLAGTFSDFLAAELPGMVRRMDASSSPV